MKMLLTSLVVAVFLAGCAGKESPPAAAPPAAQAAPTPQDEAAQQTAEEQAALEARANAAREIARAQQADREMAAQEAAAHARAEAEAAQAAAAGKSSTETSSAATDKVAPAAGQTGATGAVVNLYDLNVVAEMETTAGTMLIGFLPDAAPNHVKNFIDLARKGFYDGTRFHRVMPGFMIQGGDPFTKDVAQKAKWGSGDPGYKIKAEFSGTEHVRGTLSMARGPSPDSAGSQFFICHARAASLDKQYTVFGELLRGYDVLDKIATAPIGPQPSGEVSRPLDPVQIVHITIRPRTTDDVKQDG